MGFTVVINGKKVHELDVDPRYVDKLLVHTASGTDSVAIGYSQDVIDLEFVLRAPTDGSVTAQDAYQELVDEREARYEKFYKETKDVTEVEFDLEEEEEPKKATGTAKKATAAAKK